MNEIGADFLRATSKIWIFTFIFYLLLIFLLFLVAGSKALVFNTFVFIALFLAPFFIIQHVMYFITWRIGPEIIKWNDHTLWVIFRNKEVIINIQDIDGVEKLRKIPRVPGNTDVYIICYNQQNLVVDITLFPFPARYLFEKEILRKYRQNK